MKKLIVLITATLFFLNAHSQNLQFSRVILIDGSVQSLVTYTVPAGKVWEIKSWESGTVFLTVNDNDLYLGNSSSTAGYSTSAPGPFWLPENTVIKVGWYDDYSSEDYFSIIEYTIVP